MTNAMFFQEFTSTGIFSIPQNIPVEGQSFCAMPRRRGGRRQAEVSGLIDPAPLMSPPDKNRYLNRERGFSGGPGGRLRGKIVVDPLLKL